MPRPDARGGPSVSALQCRENCTATRTRSKPCKTWLPVSSSTSMPICTLTTRTFSNRARHDLPMPQQTPPDASALLWFSAPQKRPAGAAALRQRLSSRAALRHPLVRAKLRTGRRPSPPSRAAAPPHPKRMTPAMPSMPAPQTHSAISRHKNCAVNTKTRLFSTLAPSFSAKFAKKRRRLFPVTETRFNILSRESNLFRKCIATSRQFDPKRYPVDTLPVAAIVACSERNRQPSQAHR